MNDITDADLASVHGGMRLDETQSDNIEDRRGLSREESMRVRPQPSAPLPPLHRTPGDLSSQAGLDDIAKLPRRRR